MKPGFQDNRNKPDYKDLDNQNLYNMEYIKKIIGMNGTLRSNSFSLYWYCYILILLLYMIEANIELSVVPSRIIPALFILLKYLFFWHDEILPLSS